MAEMLLADVCLGRLAEDDETGSGAFSPVLSRALELLGAVVTYFLAFVLTAQIGGHVNWWT